MKNNRPQFLLGLLIDNKINEQELEELARLMAQSGADELINTQLKSTWENERSTVELNEELYHKITSHPRFTASLAKEKENVSQINPKPVIKLWYYAAALFLLCTSVGLVLYFFQSNNADSHAGSSTNLVKTEIDKESDSNHVTLKLSNGKQLVLDQTVVGKVAEESNIVITKNNDGQLVYDVGKVDVSSELAFNTINTPVGSHYQVILSDGTKVWLNAKSSLKFPAAFKGSQRQVELSGEGYFEVAHRKNQPFFLTAKGMTVQVLGTHFNVSAYYDDNKVTASLLEGAINASYKTETFLLRPGQQALLRGNIGTFNKQSFDTDEVMDWKNGYFIFRSEPIDEIMKKISRWYNIQVEYQGKSTKEAFGGKYLKSNSLKELLSSLELTGAVKFKVQGRRVTVLQ